MTYQEEPTSQQDVQDDYIPFSEALELFEPFDKNAFFIVLEREKLQQLRAQRNEIHAIMLKPLRRSESASSEKPPEGRKF